MYRNGIIEAVDSFILRPRDINGHTLQIIPHRVFEEKLITSMRSYLHLMAELQIESPIFVFLSLLNVRGYKITTDDPFDRYSQHSIERDVMVLPETMVENYNERVETILKPIFDLIWNACGESKSLNFDENGNWIERR